MGLPYAVPVTKKLKGSKRICLICFTLQTVLISLCSVAVWFRFKNEDLKAELEKGCQTEIKHFCSFAYVQTCSYQCDLCECVCVCGSVVSGQIYSMFDLGFCVHDDLEQVRVCLCMFS